MSDREAAKSILVVEDENVIAQDLHHSLTALGYRVTAIVGSGEAAVQSVADERPDLVLMDILLEGEMDGAAAAALLSEKDNVPVVFTTAVTDEETTSRVKETGPYGYLVKPVDRVLLRITIENALSKHALEQKLKESERKLAAAERMEAVGRLAGGVAHDFNNILSAIIGYTEMAQMKTAEDEPVRKMLGKIHTAGNRAKHLVEQLLAFSRPSPGDKRPVHPRELFREVEDTLAPTLSEGTSLVFHVKDTIQPFVCDPTQMHQLLLNLVKNAVDATKDNDAMGRGPACVTVQASSNGDDFFHFTVHDNGHGIETQHLDRIFEPFYTTKSFGEGTGMGLAVVHGIVKSLAGDIRVDSEKDQGATFTVRLPSVDAGVKKKHKASGAAGVK
jgi:signal transduction histidine kinase